jgi:hypothetical protein
MMNRASSLASVRRSVFHRPRFDVSGAAAFRLRRIRRSMWAPAPTIEEVEERLRGFRGFFASLTPDQLALLMDWEGPEILGDPNGPKRVY